MVERKQHTSTTSTRNKLNAATHKLNTVKIQLNAANDGWEMDFGPEVKKQPQYSLQHVD